MRASSIPGDRTRRPQTPCKRFSLRHSKLPCIASSTMYTNSKHNYCAVALLNRHCMQRLCANLCCNRCCSRHVQPVSCMHACCSCLMRRLSTKLPYLFGLPLQVPCEQCHCQESIQCWDLETHQHLQVSASSIATFMGEDHNVQQGWDPAAAEISVPFEGGQTLQ